MAQALVTPRRFTEALLVACNEISRRSPAPREFPFFGLDHPRGAGAKLLDRLSELGIFRHYERVLDLSAGLGGPARWLARRRGCEVASLDRDRVRAAASRALTRRAHLHASVWIGAAAFERLPARDAAFTHAWGVEALLAEPDVAAVTAELFRVVRPGGHVALQEWVAAKAAAAHANHPPVERYLDALHAAGFQAVRAVPAGELREPETTVTGIVRGRVHELLGDPEPAESSAIATAGAALERREQDAAAGRLQLVQIFAQRPA